MRVKTSLQTKMELDFWGGGGIPKIRRRGGGLAIKEGVKKSRDLECGKKEVYAVEKRGRKRRKKKINRGRERGKILCGWKGGGKTIGLWPLAEGKPRQE